MKIAIIGAAELGKLIMHHAVNDSGYEVAGFYDDFLNQKEFNARPLLGNTSLIQKDFDNGVFDQLMIAVGYTRMTKRQNIYSMFKGRIPFANIIHSSAYVDKSCNIGEGNFLLPGVVLDYGVTLHNNILLNTGTVIAHHSEIFNHCFVAPGVVIAGLVKVQECSFIGIGAVIKDCINIASFSTIGAGAVVVKDTLSNTTSIGIPARSI